MSQRIKCNTCDTTIAYNFTTHEDFSGLFLSYDKKYKEEDVTRLENIFQCDHIKDLLKNINKSINIVLRNNVYYTDNGHKFVLHKIKHEDHIIMGYECENGYIWACPEYILPKYYMGSDIYRQYVSICERYKTTPLTMDKINLFKSYFDNNNYPWWFYNFPDNLSFYSTYYNIDIYHKLQITIKNKLRFNRCECTISTLMILPNNSIIENKNKCCICLEKGENTKLISYKHAKFCEICIKEFKEVSII
jgi:hypothetical protein